MITKKIAEGIVHKLPDDFRDAIISDLKVRGLWEDITPLARNEWICWVISAKKAGTRDKRIGVSLSKMRSGEKRPCCWIGCIHRTDKPISPSVQRLLNKQSGSK